MTYPITLIIPVHRVTCVEAGRWQYINAKTQIRATYSGPFTAILAGLLAMTEVGEDQSMEAIKTRAAQRVARLFKEARNETKSDTGI